MLRNVLCGVIQTFESTDEIFLGGSCWVVLFCGSDEHTLRYKEVTIFDTEDEILNCDHLTESY